VPGSPSSPTCPGVSLQHAISGTLQPAYVANGKPHGTTTIPGTDTQADEFTWRDGIAINSLTLYAVPGKGEHRALRPRARAVVFPLSLSLTRVSPTNGTASLPRAAAIPIQMDRAINIMKDTNTSIVFSNFTEVAEAFPDSLYGWDIDMQYACEANQPTASCAAASDLL
jgi:hypothetical protein